MCSLELCTYLQGKAAWQGKTQAIASSGLRLISLQRPPVVSGSIPGNHDGGRVQIGLRAHSRINQNRKKVHMQRGWKVPIGSHALKYSDASIDGYQRDGGGGS